MGDSTPFVDCPTYLIWMEIVPVMTSGETLLCKCVDPVEFHERDNEDKAPSGGGSFLPSSFAFL
jgi:hypothetical protein